MTFGIFIISILKRLRNLCNADRGTMGGGEGERRLHLNRLIK